MSGIRLPLSTAVLTASLAVMAVVHAQQGHTNYDEAKVGSYTLPPVLVGSDGRPVRTPEDWARRRRPEILRLFEQHMHGVTPSTIPDDLTFTVTEQNPRALGGLAHRKQIELRFAKTPDAPVIHVLLYTPAAATAPVPVFLTLHFSGNWAIVNDPDVRLYEMWDRKAQTRVMPAADVKRGASPEWDVPLVLSRGYGIAAVHYGDIEPDFALGAGRPHGVRRLFAKGTASERTEHEWGAIGAWAWGMSRVLDYLETDRQVDARKVAAVGQSRLGKTVLWAGAQDRRFAMVIASCSGEGGAALSRRDYGENLDNMSSTYLYQFSEAYRRYNRNWNALPVDAHMLVSLIAPRPLFLNTGSEDQWSDPTGEFLAARAASPVWTLFGRQGLDAAAKPPLDVPIGGDVVFHEHTGRHAILQSDWKHFVDFADRQWKRASPPQANVSATTYRTLNDTFEPPRFSSAEEWSRRAAHLKDLILASAGLLPAPPAAPLQARVFGEISRPDYSVSKVYFESLPGFFVTGNLYRPAGVGPFPAIISPHGHWPYGRLENSVTASVPGRAINLARQGFVVFTYDMVGYNDSRQLEHRLFGGPREKLWGLSVAGLQLWNAIRGVDFLESLPYVRRDAIGATGASGGGTQVFLLAAVDPRIAVAAPVNMISLHMQGGCLCENQPGLRLDTTNVEIAAAIAPRPLLMVSASGDWTTNTLEREYPAVRSLYALKGAADRVHAVRFDAPHNYNRDSREAVYAWMARWLQGAPADVRREERPFTPEPLPDLLVFHREPMPAHAVTAAQLTAQWIANAREQLRSTPLDVRARALRLALALEPPTAAAPAPRKPNGRVAVVAGVDEPLMRALRTAGFTAVPVEFTPFDADEAAKIPHFDTYNRTAASQRVADIAAALRAHPGAPLVASGDAALAGLLAVAAEPGRTAVLDVDRFDSTNDDEFVKRLYIPGLRRAGDLETAALVSGGRVVLHNAAPGFNPGGVTVRAEKLTPREIAALLRP